MRTWLFGEIEWRAMNSWSRIASHGLYDEVRTADILDYGFDGHEFSLVYFAPLNVIVGLKVGMKNLVRVSFSDT